MHPWPKFDHSNTFIFFFFISDKTELQSLVTEMDL